MTKIFISYRRSDSEGYVGRLYDHLLQVIPQSEIFMDVANIEPGVDFIDAIDEAVGQCNVLISVIGPTWATVVDENGNSRLENEKDFVRLEIETALKRNIAVIPVLVGRSELPKQSEIPVSLQLLLTRNSVELRHRSFSYDVEQLAKTIRRNLQLNTVSPEIQDLISQLDGKVSFYEARSIDIQSYSKKLFHMQSRGEQEVDIALQSDLTELKDDSSNLLYEIRDFQNHIQNLEILVRHIPDDEALGQLRSLLSQYARMVKDFEDRLISILFPRARR